MIGRAAPLANPASVARVDVVETRRTLSRDRGLRRHESPQAVIAVLTDYERIPKFMPDMEISRVLERTSAASWWSNRRYRDSCCSPNACICCWMSSGTRVGFASSDRCGESFAPYEGSWIVSAHDA